MLADVLTDGDVAALEAAEGNLFETVRLIQSRVDELESAMADMALEFRGELARLGVRVNVLDARIGRIEETVDDLRTKVGNVALSGKNETVFENTSVDSVLGTVWIDPRDEDSDELEQGSEFNNTFTLIVKATPADNVTVTATLDAINHLGLVAGDDDSMSLMANLDVTTPGVLRSLHFGELDQDDRSAV